MGTNSKATHSAYALVPSTAEPSSPEPTEPAEAEASAPPAELDADADIEVDGPPSSDDELDHIPPGQLPLTEIPDTPDVGLAFGEPVLVGGDDLLASTATLVSYQSDEGPRSVLHARVSEEAELKLLDALEISPEMVPMQVEQTVAGRLPLDEKHELADKIINAAKSINHHVGKGSLVTGKPAPGTTGRSSSRRRTHSPRSRRR